MNLTVALLFLPGLIVGLTVHEFAHAWSASLLGDDYARRQGRVSLNPFRHLSPLGTLAILFLPFGWGKPVPVNLYNFKYPRRDYLLTSLAGPAANLIMVAICLGLMQITRHTYWYAGWGQTAADIAHTLLTLIMLINMMLATFNLIPIPPLDGSKIWPCLIPGIKLAMPPRTTWIFLALFFALLWTGALHPLLQGVLGGVQRLAPVSDQMVFAQHLGAAIAASEESRWADAQSAATEALAVNPENGYPFYLRAIAQGEQGDWPSALDDVNQAIARRPYSNYYAYRARIHAALHDMDQSQADMATAARLKNTLDESWEVVDE